MIATNYNTSNTSNVIFAPIARFTSPQVKFHEGSASLLTQWHHLISAIREKANRRQWVTLVNPPFIPNDDYLNEIGLGDHYVRVVRFNRNASEKLKYIQQCVQNGKSSVVAIWADDTSDLPDVLLNESPLSCQALVFSNNSDVGHRGPQLELAV